MKIVDNNIVISYIIDAHTGEILEIEK
ncbi:hypothetical protein [Streptobacillus felis]